MTIRRISSLRNINPTSTTTTTSYMVSALVLPYFLLFLLFIVQLVSSCDINDRNTLLSFKDNISTIFPHPPLTWSNSSNDCCNWEGISCNLDLKVTHLLLPSRGLKGQIQLLSLITNLTSLSHLNLSHNQFYGNLQQNFFTSSLLNHLQVLDLSYNKISGELPPFVEDHNNNNNNSVVLIEIDLSSNMFNGTLPPSLIQNLAKGENFVSFNVSNNSFTGEIFTSLFCINGSSLRFLDYSYNDFVGGIDPGLGKCSKLEIFRAGFNFLTGDIPDDVFGSVSITEISLPLNRLTGTIGGGIVGLTNLTVLELYSNHFTGEIPKEIGKLAKLERLLLHVNNFTGALPNSLMNCANLVVLNLRVNSLEGNLSEFDFSRFASLRTLDLGNNNFTGVLPQTLYSCKSLAAIRLASNNLEGQISPEILGLESLSFLSISTNKLTNVTGALRILTGLKKISTLMLSANFFNEVIPNDVNITETGGFRNLQVLGLGGCNFTGQIPDWLVNLTKLEVLDLSYNRVSGSIPPLLGKLSQLFYIDLSFNNLTGNFPIELTNLPALTSQEANDMVERTYLELPVFANANNVSQLQYNLISNLPPAIYLGNNRIGGGIPLEIGQLKVLHQLDLKDNNFSGSIPVQLSSLTNLEKLDLSGNRLSGEIPDSLKRLHFLSYFSVADNFLQGQIPTGGQFDTFSFSSFEGNAQLCGEVIQRSCPTQQITNTTEAASHRTSKKAIVGIIIGVCFGTATIMTVLSLWILSKRKINPGRGGGEDHHENKIEMGYHSPYYSNNSGVHPEEDTLVVLFPNKTNEIKDLTILEILKATENFSQANIVGCGGFGLVYKATLPNGANLAIKKLSGDLGLMEREFKAEVEALSTAQHENLVALQGYCIHEGFRLLMYTYMENGSLDYWLHEKADGASQLDWPTRLKIARGASCGLAYLHQVCEPHIVHRDIKSSNILLNEKFEAHVADFGLARLILPYQTHVTTELVGTLGYIPPEYGQAWVATLRGDVYSFGVVMLELLTGRRPIDVSKPKISRELVGWIQQMRSEGKHDQVFDPILRGKGFEEEMMKFLDVACMCVNHNPFKRPSIIEVVEWLKNV